MKNNIRILLIDDDRSVIDIITMFLEESGFCFDIALSGERGLEILEKDNNLDIILLDQKLPGISGQDVFTKVKQINKSIQVIMMTAYATVPEAVSAIRNGVSDYLTKPISRSSLELAIGRAMTIIQLSQEVNALRKALTDVNKQDGIITQDKVMLGILEKAKAVAAIDSTVMISGRSGTGKELFAKAIHNASPRAKGPFIAINCAALTEELLGSLLFGFEKGAFTGAIKTTKGCLEEAAGGTLFLDEVGDMSPKLQSSLLRALQEREFYRMGSMKPIKTDFRLITASNKIMSEEVKALRFREDLYYRLNVVPINLPPLKERVDDIPLLALHFLNKYNTRMNKNIGPYSSTAIHALKNHDWRGNCRELENVIENIVAIKEDGQIELSDLPAQMHNTDMNNMNDSKDTESINTYEEMKNKSEKMYFGKALEICGGNITKLSRIANLSRSVLYDKLKKHNLR